MTGKSSSVNKKSGEWDIILKTSLLPELISLIWDSTNK